MRSTIIHREKMAQQATIHSDQPARQSGYVALFILMVLMGTGSLWVGSSLTPGRQRIVATSDQISPTLANARQSLIHYAVNYIDMYGPRGAGPGHLPCPDTDSHGALGETSNVGNDGPNPPCGNTAVAVGRLPRHVSLHDQRYAFHGNNSQHLLYAVSTGYINNPTNRPVNPGTRGVLQVDTTDDVIAVIVEPAIEPISNALSDNTRWPPNWPLNQHGGSQFTRLAVLANGDRLALIRSADLRAPVMRRVSAWMVGHLATASVSRCANQPVCWPYLPFNADCEEQLTYPLLAYLLPGRHDCSAQQTVEDLGQLLEGVTAQRHWFIRNAWHESSVLIVNSNCLHAMAGSCEFLPDSINSNSRRVTIRLLPVVTGASP